MSGESGKRPVTGIDDGLSAAVRPGKIPPEIQTLEEIAREGGSRLYLDTGLVAALSM